MKRLKKDLGDQLKDKNLGQTEEIIIQAAIQILENEKSFKQALTKDIVSRSGFSVGSIYRYFNSKEDIYSKIWIYFTSSLHQELINKIENFPVTADLNSLMTLIADHYIDGLKKRRQTVGIHIFRLYIKNTSTPELAHTHVNLILKPIAQCIEKNKSGTMAVLTDAELKLYMMAGIAMIRTSYMEQDKYFGTPNHRLKVINALTKLFSS